MIHKTSSSRAVRASSPGQKTSYRPQDEKSRIDRAMQALARSRLGGWLFINVFPIVDRLLIPVSGGRLKVAMGQPILLLHTRGARSGQPRTTPLLYTPHCDTFVIVASKAGAEHHPSWYHNIRAHPDDVAIEVGGIRIPVRPRVVEGAERDELWRRVNDNYNGYDTYQGRAGGRLIPVISLQP
jgi:deazaflavin-dependent oxidoreductase (nitroreductase family)